MYIGSELAPAVVVAEKVAYDGKDDANGLEGDVPAGADDLRTLVCGTEREYGEGGR